MKDSVDVFMDQAARIPLLTTEEEIHLGRSVRRLMAITEDKPNGPYTKAERIALHRGKRAKDRFVKANLRLVVNIARLYERRMSSMLDMKAEDLMQEGMLGLIRAVERFDPERGYKFSTYAYWWIKQSMNRGIHMQARTIRLPVHIAEKAYSLNRTRERLTYELKRSPTIPELAEAMGWEPEILERVLTVGGRQSSLDGFVTEDGMMLGDIVSDGRGADDHLEEVAAGINRDKVMQMMCFLTENEKIAVRMRFGFEGSEKTFKQVGERLGLTRERARQLVGQATHKLKRLAYERDVRLAA